MNGRPKRHTLPVALAAAAALTIPLALWPQGTAPGQPAKEYIRLDGRVIAVENALPVGGAITATQNPVMSCDPNGLAIATLNWTATGVQVVHIRVSAPNGPTMAGGGPTGSAATGLWVSNGTPFYLIDVTPGRPEAVLGSVVVGVTTAGCPNSLSALPNPIFLSGTGCQTGLGQTAINWQAAAPVVHIRVDSANGPTMAGGGPTGTAMTGPWVSNGTPFFSVNPSTNQLLNSLVVNTSTANCPKTGTLSANPNPIPPTACSGSPLTGITTLTWTAPPPVQAVRVRIGDPNGGIFAYTGATTTPISKVTGDWMTEGLQVYLMESLSPDPPINGAQLATYTASLNAYSCVSVIVSPNVTVLSTGQSENFAATVTNTANQAVTWTIDSSPPAGAIASNGMYTAPSPLTDAHIAQSVALTARSAANPSATGTGYVILERQLVDFGPTGATVAAGVQRPFDVTVRNPQGVEQIQWISPVFTQYTNTLSGLNACQIVYYPKIYPSPGYWHIFDDGGNIDYFNGENSQCIIHSVEEMARTENPAGLLVEVTFRFSVSFKPGGVLGGNAYHGMWLDAQSQLGNDPTAVVREGWMFRGSVFVTQ